MPRERLGKNKYYDDDKPSACCSCWKDAIYLAFCGLVTCVVAGALCVTFGMLYQPSRKLVDDCHARVSVTARKEQFLFA